VKIAYQNENVTLWHGNCLEWSGKADAVLTDPPYGIDGASGTINRARNKGGYGGEWNDSTDYVADVCAVTVRRLIAECKAVVVTPGCKNMMKYPQPDSFGCFFQPAAVGLQTFGNMDAQPIFYYGRNLTGKNMGKRCSFTLTEAPEKNGHPCVKPLQAWKVLLCQFTSEGDTVLDPFCGSGTTLIAALETGRKAIGIEIDDRWVEVARKRLERWHAQGRFDFSPANNKTTVET
jgi:DNA modification methylase